MSVSTRSSDYRPPELMVERYDLSTDPLIEPPLIWPQSDCTIDCRTRTRRFRSTRDTSTVSALPVTRHMNPFTYECSWPQ